MKREIIYAFTFFLLADFWCNSYANPIAYVTAKPDTAAHYGLYQIDLASGEIIDKIGEIGPKGFEAMAISPQKNLYVITEWRKKTALWDISVPPGHILWEFQSDNPFKGYDTTGLAIDPVTRKLFGLIKTVDSSGSAYKLGLYVVDKYSSAISNINYLEYRAGWPVAEGGNLAINSAGQALMVKCSMSVDFRRRDYDPSTDVKLFRFDLQDGVLTGVTKMNFLESRAPKKCLAAFDNEDKLWIISEHGGIYQVDFQKNLFSSIATTIDGINSLAIPITAPNHKAAIQSIYIAYYGRPGDPAGMDFWSRQLSQHGGLDSVIEQFGTSIEFNEQYGNLSDEQLVDNIFKHMFCRNPDPKGRAYYLERLQSGKSTLPTITLDILNGAQNNDALIIENKRNVASYFTSEVERLGLTYQSDDILSARWVLDAVCGESGDIDKGFMRARSVLGEM